MAVMFRNDGQQVDPSAPKPHYPIIKREDRERMQRCPQCGGKVLMPCYACAVKSYVPSDPKQTESKPKGVPQWLM